MMWFQVSALTFCALTAVALSSVIPAVESDAEEITPVAERRTFKLKKKLSLLKKHKKFGGWLPHIFGKTEYRGIPTPIYKVHRYHGLEVKPIGNVEEISFLTSGPHVETHDVVHTPETDFVAFVPDDHIHQPILPPAPPVFDHVSYPLNLPVLPTPLPPVSTFGFLPPATVQTHVPLPAPAWPSLPIKIPFAPTVAPVTLHKPIVPEVQSFHHTAVAHSTPAPLLSVTPSPVKLPAPGAPLLPPLILPHSFSSLPLALPSPPALPHLPPVPLVSTPAPILAAHPEPEFSFPSHDVPVTSLIKDVSDQHPHHVEIDHAEPALTVFEEGHTPTAEPGIFQKLKGWKAEKVSSAISKIKTFKNPVTNIAAPEIVAEAPVVNFQVPVAGIHPDLYFPEPFHHSTIHSPQVFLPTSTPLPPAFLPVKYESFPPYPPQVTPQLFNSYGVPIPADSYAPPHHFSHDRVSSAASEEKSSLLPAPSSLTEKALVTEKDEKVKEVDQQQDSSQIVPVFSSQKTPLQAVRSSADLRPVYTPEESKTSDEETKGMESIAEIIRNSNQSEVNFQEANQNDETSNHKQE